MKPAPFEYFAPESVEESLALLAEHPGEAKLLAGGQSLMPLMAFRLARPSVLIDLRKVAALRDYALDDAGLTVGSMVTHRAVELDRRIMSKCALLAEALDVVGHVAIRNVGTVGGSLAHADPAAEWPVVALALDAEMTIASPIGSRVVGAEQFFTGWMSTCLADDEILTGARFAMPGPGTGSAFEEMARRHGDFAIVGVAAVITAVEGVVTNARITVAGAAMTPVRAAEAEAALINTSLDATSLDALGEAAAVATDPIPDLHATVEYKRRLAAVLSRRAVARAYQRAVEAA